MKGINEMGCAFCCNEKLNDPPAIQFVAGVVSWAVIRWEDNRMIIARKLSFIKEIDGV